MSNQTISHLSDIATQKQNVAGVTTPILEIEPSDGTILSLLNRVPQGSAEGLPVFFELYDSDGNPLPVDTDLIFRAVRPEDDEPTTVSVKETNISPWDTQKIAEQRNEENIDSVKIELKGDRVNIRDVDQLRVEINSQAQVDWSNPDSQLYLARKGVERNSYGGRGR